jgi:hypothetical protein
MMNHRQKVVPIWQALYEIAVLETNPALVQQRASNAEQAVWDRLGKLRGGPNEDEELSLLAKTLEAIRSLQETHWSV